MSGVFVPFFSRCQRKRPKRETAELDEGTTWIENPNGDWNGFRQSELPNAANMYYAQCKTCLCILEALTEDMEDHKATCNSSRLRSSDIVLEQDAPKEDPEVVAIIEEVVDEDEEEAQEEDVHYSVDMEPHVSKKPRQVFNPYVKIINAPATSTAAASSVVADEASPSSPSCSSCGKPRISTFDEAARVWAQKLNDLPLEQALSIEKKMSDMLFEAIITDLQTKKALQKKDGH